MNQPNLKTIKPVRVPAPGPGPKPGEEVFHVQDKPPIEVAPGDTVEIIISSSERFSVFLPFEGHFDERFYEAEENPAWALEKMEAVDGGSSKTAKGSVWGVRMTRISQAGDNKPSDFPYCLYSEELKTFAVGNSPPTMTLKP